MALQQQTTRRLFQLFRLNGSLRGTSKFEKVCSCTSLLTQTLVVLMLRTQHIPFFQSWPSRVIGVALAIIASVGLAIPYIPPIAAALLMQHPHPLFYGFLVVILVCYMLLVQLVKTVYIRIYKEWI